MTPLHHVRLIVRSVCEYLALSRDLPGPVGRDRTWIFAGRSMGILSALTAVGCVDFEDAVLIAVSMGRLHISSYARRGQGLISRRLHGLSDRQLELLISAVVSQRHACANHQVFVLEHDPSRSTLLQYPDRAAHIVDELVSEQHVPCSRAAVFQSSAHTSLTRPDLGQLLGVLDSKVQLRPPPEGHKIYSQSATMKRWQLHTATDIRHELIDVSTAPMDLRRVMVLFDQISRTSAAFSVHRIGTFEP